MRCTKCDGELEVSKFLGWPASMWYEVMETLAKEAGSDLSPLAALSIVLSKRKPRTGCHGEDCRCDPCP